MNRKIPIIADIFAEDRSDSGKSDWLAQCKNAEWLLSSVRNPYVGNKRKMLVFLGDVVFEEGLHHRIADGGKVLDLFSGSGFVSYLFKTLGASVWSNDILASSFINALALIETQHKAAIYDSFSSKMNLYQGMIAGLLAEPSEQGCYIKQKYVPKRFSEKEAERIDAIRANMSSTMSLNLFLDSQFTSPSHLRFHKYFGQEVSDPQKEYNPYSHSAVAIATIMHYIMDSCFVGGRLNSGQILAKYDHRVAHDRNGGQEMSFRLEDMPIFNIAHHGNTVCRATRSDATALLEASDSSPELRKVVDDLDLVYIDPPYGGDQSDYPYMYDFLEDFLFYGDDSCRKLGGENRFTASKTYEQSFSDLISKLPNNAVWLFSYNDSSWSDIDGIVSVIKKYRNKVKVYEKGYNYNQRKDRSSGVEYVIAARPE